MGEASTHHPVTTRGRHTNVSRAPVAPRAEVRKAAPWDTCVLSHRPCPGQRPLETQRPGGCWGLSDRSTLYLASAPRACRPHAHTAVTDVPNRARTSVRSAPATHVCKRFPPPLFFDEKETGIHPGTILPVTPANAAGGRGGGAFPWHLSFPPYSGSVPGCLCPQPGLLASLTPPGTVSHTFQEKFVK